MCFCSWKSKIQKVYALHFILAIRGGVSQDSEGLGLNVGDTFGSFVELFQKLEEFQKKTFTMFKIRNCFTKAQGEKLKREKKL